MISTIQNITVQPEEVQLVRNVQKHVEEIYESKLIFTLSLESLELTRRFNQQYIQIQKAEEIDPFELDKFLQLTKHLERNLLVELK